MELSLSLLEQISAMVIVAILGIDCRRAVRRRQPAIDSSQNCKQ